MDWDTPDEIHTDSMDSMGWEGVSLNSEKNGCACGLRGLAMH